MNDESPIVFFLGFIIGATAMGFGVGIGVTNSWKSEAVEAGHAEYVLDGDKAVWRWKDVQTLKEGK